LESLRIAGIEFVPGAAPPEVKPAPPAPPRRLSVPIVSVTPVVQTGLLATVSIETPPLDEVGERQRALADLARQVSQCVRCPQLASTRTQTVFGVGPLDPD